MHETKTVVDVMKIDNDNSFTLEWYYNRK